MKLWQITFHGHYLSGVGIVFSEDSAEAREALIKKHPDLRTEILSGESVQIMIPKFTSVIYSGDGDY